jgi:hypothetical protein
VYLYFTAAAVTGDFMVDTLEHWWRQMRERFVGVTTLVINQDNGPENQSRRTQFLKRMVEFARDHALLIRLAYYPPYHSKYNAIERCRGILENPWNVWGPRTSAVSMRDSLTQDLIDVRNRYPSGSTWLLLRLDQ